MRPRLKSNDPQDIAEWVGDGMDELHDRITAHVDKRTEEQNKLFNSTFPGGDPSSIAAPMKNRSTVRPRRRRCGKPQSERKRWPAAWAGHLLAMAALDSVNGMLHR